MDVFMSLIAVLFAFICLLDLVVSEFRDYRKLALPDEAQSLKAAAEKTRL